MKRMNLGAKYEPLSEEQYYIDKTQVLEKGMVSFPSIYIEGAAASGKTTAVRMLLNRHPEVESVVFWMDEEQTRPSEFCRKLEELKSFVRNREAGPCLWIVFENLPADLPEDLAAAMALFLRHIPDTCHAILLGRERPEREFLDLIWKRRMELISQEVLLLTKNDVRDMVEHAESSLDPEELYEETGGWAGCVDMMLRMSLMYFAADETGKKTADTHHLRSSYEIRAYIQREILDTLSGEEQEIMRRAAVCPWLNAELCLDVWGMEGAQESLEMLSRKGMLLHDSVRNRWRIAPLFQNDFPLFSEEGDAHRKPFRFWVKLGQWYGQRGFVREALQTLKMSGDKNEIRSFMMDHFREIPFCGLPWDEVMEWKEPLPQLCYLRGMCCYFHQNQEGLDREISRLRKMKLEEKDYLEIILNLTYVKPDFSLEEWLDLLERSVKQVGPLSLYAMLGSSATFLCGLRDLSGMFACTKKEENRRARLWKESLGDWEYMGYCLARIDYYLEIRQKDAIRQEDWDMLKASTEHERWQFRLVSAYLLCKILAKYPDPSAEEHLRQVQESLLREENELCVRNTEIVRKFYFYWNNEREKFTRWLLNARDNYRMEVNEDNYYSLFCLAKGFMLINQYQKAEKILQKLIPYLQFYRRTYLMAEALFEQAIIYLDAGKHSQSLRSTIESFLVNGDCHYVRMYTLYGVKGSEVLDAYITWMRSNRPEGWHRKKKYSYGNVLRMPLEDYMEAVLHYAKKAARSVPAQSQKSREENLTMMETLILQNLGLGVSNEEICKELNLKLPTVKSHIYSIYKKLNASNRVQAVLKGKELGILK